MRKFGFLALGVWALLGTALCGPAFANMKAVSNTVQTTLGVSSIGSTLTNSGGALNTTQPIDAQTGTSYTVLSSDAGNIVTFNNSSAVAVTLPQATTNGFTSGFSFTAQNLGAGQVTITPTTSTINGAATLTLLQHESCQITSDGTNYQVSACIPVAPVCRVVSAGGAGWTNTGIGTSEVTLVSAPIPTPMDANGWLEVNAVWEKNTTPGTDSYTFTARLSSTGCTAGTACTLGSAFINITDTSTKVSFLTDTVIQNANATNSQVFWPNASVGNISTSGTISTAGVDTTTGLFVNLDCTTGTSSADTCKLIRYDIKECNP